MPKITIYTTPWCSYCDAAKSLLVRKGAAFEEIDVGGDRGLRQAMTLKANGDRKVPQIFIGENHIGGCDELYDLDHQGGLDPLLAAL